MSKGFPSEGYSTWSMTRTSTGLVRGCNLSLSCHHLLPLPVIFVQLNDQERSAYYVDPKPLASC